MVKKGLKLGQQCPELTPTEQEILYLLTKEYLTIKQASIRRKTSVQYTYKIVKNLKNKGVLKQGLNMVENSRTTFKPLNHSIRLHGQEFNIKLLHHDDRYKAIRHKANTINIDGNTIRLYNNSIEVYSGKSFFADDTQKATVESFQYWNRFFIRLESEFKIIILKSRLQNIKLVNQHYAETNNELAEESEKKGDKIRVYTTEDGKLWFTIDNSFNLHEAETQHPQTAQQDMNDIIKPFFNDLRDNKPLKLSEFAYIITSMTKMLQIQAEQNKETAAGVNAISQYLKSQLPTQEEKFEQQGEKSTYIG